MLDGRAGLALLAGAVVPTSRRATDFIAGDKRSSGCCPRTAVLGEWAIRGWRLKDGRPSPKLFLADADATLHHFLGSAVGSLAAVRRAVDGLGATLVHGRRPCWNIPTFAIQICGTSVPDLRGGSVPRLRPLQARVPVCVEPKGTPMAYAVIAEVRLALDAEVPSRPAWRDDGHLHLPR